MNSSVFITMRVIAVHARGSNKLPNASQRLVAGDKHHLTGLHLPNASANLRDLRRCKTVRFRIITI